MKKNIWRIRWGLALAVWLLGFCAGSASGSASGSAIAALPDPVRFGAVVEQGDLESVREWLESGLSPDFIADRVGSGLMVAAWEGNIAMMELFLKHGARIGLSNRHDEQALQLAAWRGHLEAVKWLLAHGASVNRPGQRWNALHYAAFADHKEIARLLIARGAEVNSRAPNGSTALMMTAREGRDELARMLLDAGADPQASNEQGDSALTWAMRHKHFRIAQMVSTAPAFAKAVQAPPESFGAAVRSRQAPPEIEEILRQMRLLQATGKPVDDLRKTLFDAVARFKQGSEKIEIGKTPPGKSAKRGKPQVLVITARRGQGKQAAGERAELVYARNVSIPLEGKATRRGASPAKETAQIPNDVPSILEQMARAHAAGKPVDELRKAFFEAVARIKKGEADSSR